MTDCHTLDEVRAQIDRIDNQLVRLLAERAVYARQAGRFKAPADVHAPARVEQVVARVRALAADHKTDPDLVERVYRTMIAALTDIQIAEKAGEAAR